MAGRYLGVVEEVDFGTAGTVNKYIDVIREGISGVHGVTIRKTV